MTSDNSEFPKYQITIDGQEHWLPLRKAGIELNSYFAPVSLGSKALEASGVTRDITQQERNQMIDIADEWDAAK